MISEDNSKCTETLELVQRTVASAKMTDLPTVATTPYEWSIFLPIESASPKIFPEMFKELEGNKANLGVLSVALSQSTLDEVFMR